MTEFAVVIPVLLLFFLAILQYLQIFRATQHANYAAYAAARSYAVHASVDGHDVAFRKALDAACVALAPVARFAPGEVSGLSARTTGTAGLNALAEGYLAARYHRMLPESGGGNLGVFRAPGGLGFPEQIDVEINFPQPIAIPGLGGLWRYVTGARMESDLAPLAAGLGGNAPASARDSLPGWFGVLFPDFNEAADGLIRGSPRTVLLPCVNVRARCSMGFEDWGKRRAFRPRRAGTVGEASEREEDRRTGREADRTVADSRKFRSTLDEERRKCSALAAARQARNHAETEYNRTPATPPESKQQALDRLNQAAAAELKAQREYDFAAANLKRYANRLGALAGFTPKLPECE